MARLLPLVGAAGGVGVAAYGLRARRPALVVLGSAGALAGTAVAAFASADDGDVTSSPPPPPPPPPVKPKLSIGLISLLGRNLHGLNRRSETQLLTEAQFVSLRTSTSAVMRATGAAAGTALAGVLGPLHPLELLGRTGMRDQLARYGMQVISPVWRLKSNGKAKVRGWRDRNGVHDVCDDNPNANALGCDPRDESNQLLSGIRKAEHSSRRLALQLARVLMPEFDAGAEAPTAWEPTSGQIAFGPVPTAAGPAASLVAPRATGSARSRAEATAQRQQKEAAIVRRDQTMPFLDAMSRASDAMPSPLLMQRYWMLRTFCETVAPLLSYMFVPRQCGDQADYEDAVDYIAENVIDPFATNLAGELRAQGDPRAAQRTQLDQNIRLALRDYWSKYWMLRAGACPPPPAPSGFGAVLGQMTQLAGPMIALASGNPGPLVGLAVSSLTAYAPPELRGAINTGLAAVAGAEQFGTGGFSSLRQLGVEYSDRALALAGDAMDAVGLKIGSATAAFSSTGLAIQNGNLGLTVGPDGTVSLALL